MARFNLTIAAGLFCIVVLLGIIIPYVRLVNKELSLREELIDIRKSYEEMNKINDDARKAYSDGLFVVTLNDDIEHLAYDGYPCYKTSASKWKCPGREGMIITEAFCTVPDEQQFEELCLYTSTGYDGKHMPNIGSIGKSDDLTR